MSLALKAPAKTNLFLEVLRKRKDGYHELDTIFIELELSDDLTIEAAPEGLLEVECRGDPTVPSGPDNLVWQAGEALRSLVGRPELGARIAIEKHIPSGGGLGGGSSDAAITLLGLDRLWGLNLGVRGLVQVAATIGSDCAFFIEGGVQRGTSRGENLEVLPRLERPLDLVLLLPGIACPTPKIYRALAPHLPAEPRSSDGMRGALRSGDPTLIAHELWNRLEIPCFQLYPAVQEAKANLERRGLLRCLLSGSGSTVLGIAQDQAQAQEVARKLTEEGLRAFATRSASLPRG